MPNGHHNLKRVIIGTSLALMCLSSVVNAQQMKIIRAGESGGFLIPELMTFVGPEKNQLIVTERMPSDRLPREYQAVDIRQGDIILMVNGKKVSKPDELEKLYEGLAVGQEMKLGLKRGSDMLIASFKKADPSTLPMMRKIVKVEDDGEGGEPMVSVGNGLSVDGEPVPMLEIGVIFAVKDGEITVGGALPVPGVALLKSEPEAGDVLVSLQGSSVTTAESLRKAWDAIPAGDTVRLVISREGKETLSVFAKPKTMGEIKIKGAK